MAMIKKLYSFPPCTPKPITIETLPNELEVIDKEPEELQRGEVCSVEWSQWIIASILIGVRLPKFTWSKQRKPYDIIVCGIVKKVWIKNIDSLQRITSIERFVKGEINIPKGIISTWEQNETYYGKREIDLSGLSYVDFKFKYPELFREKWNNYRLEIDEYGVEGNYLKPQQETYLFKTVLNNGNTMNGQQWRNPTVSAIASCIRQDARLNPIDLFKIDTINNEKVSKCFSILNPKMEYDEILAILSHFLVYGVTRPSNKTNMDNMYEDPNLTDDVNIFSPFLNKDINIQTEYKRVCNFMYQILKDTQYKGIIDKGYIFSLLYYSFLHIDKFGYQSKFDYKNLKKQFFQLHSEMVELTSQHKKLNVDATPFRDALARKGVKYTKLIINEWVEKLGWDKDIRFE
jgi:hypothetical protein